MAVSVWATVEGVPTLTATLGRITDKTAKKIRRKVEVAGNAIFRHAVTFAPPPRRVMRFTKERFTLALKGGFQQHPIAGGMGVEVSNLVRYARFVEYGTGRRGAARSGSLVYRPPGYRYGAKPGMFPQPFMHPGFQREGKKFLRECEQIIGETITEEMRW